MAADKNITEIAQKQRYLALLKKMKTGRALTKKELTELGGYQKRYDSKKKKTTGRSSKRLPISINSMINIGYGYGDITTAENDSEMKISIRNALAKHPELKAAYDRGQFLRNIKIAAETGEDMEELAAILGIKTVKELKDIIKNDFEAKTIWNNCRADRI